MPLSTYILLPLLRGGLFVGCRLTLLPWLFGEAKYASLDVTATGDESNNGNGSSSLPTPVTSNGASHSRMLSKVKGIAQGSKGSAAPSLWSLSPSAFAALLLSLSFEESTILFLLVLLEAMGFDADTLRTNWQWSLAGLVLLAVCFIPMGLSILITYPLLPASSARTAMIRRLLLSLIPFVLWLVLFVKVPLPERFSTSSILESALARTAVVGVTLIALLSGSGAIGAAMDSYEAWAASSSGRRNREPSASDVRSAEASFTKACEDLQRTKREVERVQATADLSEGESGVWAGLGRAFRGSNKDRELKALNVELSSLSMLAGTMRDELDQLRARRKEAEYRTTLTGRAWILIGYAFAAYCVMRLFVSFLSLFLFSYSSTSSSSSPDLLSTLLAKFLHLLFNLSIDVPTWSKQISLLFLGLLILGRLRVVLTSLAQLFRAAASPGISTSFLICVMSEIMVIYLLATLIQLRTSLPPSFAGGEAPTMTTTALIASRDSSTSQPLLATLPDFNIVFGALFDATFLLSAAGTLAWRWFTGRQETVLFGNGSASWN